MQYGEISYGLKCHEFRKFIELPQRVSEPFEIALNIHPADAKDREALQNRGWRLVDPARVTITSYDPGLRLVELLSSTAAAARTGRVSEIGCPGTTT